MSLRVRIPNKQLRPNYASTIQSLRLSCSPIRLLATTTNVPPSSSIESNSSDPTRPRNPLFVPLISKHIQSQLFPAPGSEFAPRKIDPKAINLSIEHLQANGLYPQQGEAPPPLPKSPATDFLLPKLQGKTLSHHFHALGEFVAEPYLGMSEEFASFKIASKPNANNWKMTGGWTKYSANGTTESVPFVPPEEDVLVFDVETLPFKADHFPIIAVAVGKQAWYGWVSPWLAGEDSSPNHLVPLTPVPKSDSLLENENTPARIVIGHNVLFDRARILDEYTLTRPATRYLDTLSLHVAISGISSPQRGAWLGYRKEKDEAELQGAEEEGPALLPVTDEPTESTPGLAENASNPRWQEVSSLNSLAHVARLHCKINMSKKIRDVFIDPKTTIEDVRANFRLLMDYCATDVRVTYKVYQKVLPAFRKTCPHPVSFAGILLMSQPVLPVDYHWPQYLERAETLYKKRMEEVNDSLLKIADETRQLMHQQDEDGNYVWEKDVWLRMLDWSPVMAKLPSKSLSSECKQPIPAWFGSLKKTKNDGLKIDLTGPVASALLDLRWRGYPVVHSRLLGYLFAVPKSDEPWDGAERQVEIQELHPARDEQLIEKMKDYDLFVIPHRNGRPHVVKTLLTRMARSIYANQDRGALTSDVEGFMEWAMTKDDNNDASEALNQTLVKRAITYSTMKKEHCPFSMQVLDWTTRSSKNYVPLAEKESIRQFLWPAWYASMWDSAKGIINVSVRKRAIPFLLKLLWNGFPVVHSSEHGWIYRVPLGQELSNAEPLTFEKEKDSSLLIDQANYYKIPHPDGSDANVGQPLAHPFGKAYEAGILSSTHDAAKAAIDLSATCSYWTSSRERIKNQMVIWGGDPKLSAPSPPLTESTSSPEAPNSRGLILPQVLPMGTVTRRSVEKTWLTASNAKKNRLGSELKSNVRAPPGYAIVGADVDSEELWICSVLGDAQFGVHGATAVGWMTLEGTKNAGTDLHSKSASILGISRDDAKVFNYSRLYGAGVKHAVELLGKANPNLSKEDATKAATALYASTKGLTHWDKYFGHKFWHGGTESHVFNKLEEIAQLEEPKTPVLGSGLTSALRKTYLRVQDEKNVSEYLTSRINWAVQSSGVDYLHLLVVSMEYLTRKFNIDARYMISVHDEVRYLVKEADRYRAAMALQIANLWTRSLFVYRLEMSDLPQSCAFFSAVDIDSCFRKEVNMSCVTPSNPDPIPFGESLDIDQCLEKTLGSLYADGRPMTDEPDNLLGSYIQLNQEQIMGSHRATDLNYLAAQAKKNARKYTNQLLMNKYYNGYGFADSYDAFPLHENPITSTSSASNTPILTSDTKNSTSYDDMSPPLFADKSTKPSETARPKAGFEEPKELPKFIDNELFPASWDGSKKAFRKKSGYNLPIMEKNNEQNKTKVVDFSEEW